MARVTADADTLRGFFANAGIFISGNLLTITGIFIVIAFLGYVRQFFAPLADLSQVYNTYQGAAAALERIDEYLSLKPEIREKQIPFFLKKKEGEISLFSISALATTVKRSLKMFISISPQGKPWPLSAPQEQAKQLW